MINKFLIIAKDNYPEAIVETEADAQELIMDLTFDDFYYTSMYIIQLTGRFPDKETVSFLKEQEFYYNYVEVPFNG